MNRTERHHLKDNELANFAVRARHIFEDRQSQVGMVAAAVVVALVAGIGYWAWNSRVQGRADTLLAEAMITGEAEVTPAPAPDSPAATSVSFPTAREKHQASLTKFKIAADEYPSTDAGIFARYRQAATYMALGEPKGAAEAYQQVIDRAGDSLYGQMARLGLAEAQAQQGAVDAAIATFLEMAQRTDGPVPVDGVLVRLARVYLDADKKDDAQKTYTRLVEEFPDSPFTPEARRELDLMKKT